MEHNVEHVNFCTMITITIYRMANVSHVRANFYKPQVPLCVKVVKTFLTFAYLLDVPGVKLEHNAFR